MEAVLPAFRREGTVVLAAVDNAARRFAAARGNRRCASASGAQVGATEEVAIWEDSYNKKHVKTKWMLTTADARVKLKRLYSAM